MEYSIILQEVVAHVEFIKSKGEVYRSSRHIAEELSFNDIYINEKIVEKIMIKKGYQKTLNGDVFVI